MSVFGGLEDNAPGSNQWATDQDQEQDQDHHPAPWGVSNETHGVTEHYGTSRSHFGDTESANGSGMGTRPSEMPSALFGGAVDAPVATEAAKKRKRHRLTVRVTRIEPNKGDPIVWFDIVTTLPRFRTTTFRDVRRTHHEIRRFADHLASANPECFVPALPPAATSFPPASAENSDRLRFNIQRWFDRVTRSPLLARDEEFVYFVESPFGYSPVVKITAPATGLARKMIKQRQPPDDEVTELREFRPVAKLIYMYATESQGRMGKVSRVRRNLAMAFHDLSAKMAQMVQAENKKGMINMWSKLGKVVHTAGDLENVKATLGDALYGDGMGLLAADAYMIKETLTNRHILMRDLVKSQEASRSKHQTATRLKGSTSISPAKVDEAITALEDATQLERRITSAVRRVTDNLVVEKPLALARMETDVLGLLKQTALRFIDAERRTLSAWESIRRDIRAVDKSGGLSRLGREGTPYKHAARSQSLAGDSWAGDRTVRAKDLLPLAKGSDEVVDAKSAASILAESVF